MNQPAEADRDETQRQDPWQSKLATILPLVAFFSCGVFIDTSPLDDGQNVNPTAYLVLVIARVVLMSGLVLFFWAKIRSMFPLAIDAWGWLVGLVGGVLWISVCSLGWEQSIWDAIAQSSFGQQALGLLAAPRRDAVNPFDTYTQAGLLVCFLFFRFTLLALCVPIAEELMLRGCLMRAVETEDWTELPLTRVGRFGVLAVLAYAAVSHPGEWIAALLWFSLVTWLMFKTGKFWNCVLAHCVTNLMLGIYVCWFGQWQLW
ncbi:MAG: CPBP family glutamic-type intramembrane protease [Planctomycetota bacterium]